ncbi:MAG: hypothetical protein PHF31_01285 [Methylobacter sp.]|nr:hypothetical protein [Methylobacter sp.]
MKNADLGIDNLGGTVQMQGADLTGAVFVGTIVDRASMIKILNFLMPLIKMLKEWFI